MAEESIIYRQTLNPAEQRGYPHNWSNDLADGETITAAAETMIEAVGVSKVDLTFSTPDTVITLTGGTHGQRCIFSILIETSSGRKYSQVFEIDVVNVGLMGSALVIEDGSGRPDANCFSGLSATDTYWANRNDATWAGATTEQKKAAKINATDYLNYGYRWLGQPVKLGQALCFPRANIVDYYGNLLPHTVIPEQIKIAEHMLAREALSIDIMSQTDPAKLIKSESVSIGAITESKTYELGNRRPLAMHTFTHIDAVLQGFTSGSVGRSGFRSVPLRPA